MTTAYHTPVLLRESVDGLNICKAGEVFVDVTFGGGGHSLEILRRLQKVGGGHLYGFDQDQDAEANVPNDEHFTFVGSNFRYLSNWMRYYGVEQIDGLIADLGVSSHHLDDEKRGFSFRFEAPLDMRMNRNSKRTAADILNEESEEKLSEIFRIYGEFRQANRLAAAIVKQRQQKRIATTADLLRLLLPLCNKEREKKEQAKIFQALRISVNNEMDALADMLRSAIELLKPAGRLVVISYHSVEDRIVKNMMKSGTQDGQVTKDFYGVSSSPMRLVNRRVILPSEGELSSNPRARSAKLRIAEKIG